MTKVVNPRICHHVGNSHDRMPSVRSTIYQELAKHDTPLLGRFSEEIYKQKLARGERVFGEPLSMEPMMEICGLYCRGNILNNVEIIFPSETRGYEEKPEFYVLHKTLSDEERELLQGVPDIKLLGIHEMYQSNPYNSDLSLMKLYRDPKTRKVHRCVIKDLYCVPQPGRGLALIAGIALPDLGYSLTCYYEHIFDYSQRTGYLAEKEPEAIPARLYLPGQDRNKTLKIHHLLKQMLNDKTIPRRIYNVKILDYESEVYEVDVINGLERSFLNDYGLIETHSSDTTGAGGSSLDGDDASVFNFSQIAKVLPTVARRRIKRRSLKVSEGKDQGPRKEVLPCYIGALQYFTRLLKLPRLSGGSLMKYRLFKVLVLDWHEPDQLILLPFDPCYSFEAFMKALQSLECVKQAADIKNKIENKVYKPGEFIFFKNPFRDDELGTWLRGVVVSLSCYNKHNLVISQRRTLRAKLENHKLVVGLVNEGKVHPDEIIYRVRSVDYGCEARSSALHMRSVSDLHEFKSICTWSLRCTLYGVHPFESDNGDYSEQCLDYFDGWIRAKKNEDEAGFRVLFRTFLDAPGAYSSFDSPIEVSLFHRYDPPTAESADLLQPKPARYEYLNWHLVERGFASSSDAHGINSNIQLEDHVISRLVSNSAL